MRVYHDEDADLNLLQNRQVAVIGYGNQGRAQALNLRDSGVAVIIGNREDGYADRAREDGFSLLSIDQAAVEADIVMLLLPDEVTPAVYEKQIAPYLGAENVLVFASGYNIAFEFIKPSPPMDVVLVAPRMIGAGVRDLYVAGRGFPAFIGVHQDYSGQAKRIALALAKGIGSTRAGVVEVTFAQEAELDLFTEQCFGPAFGHVLMTAIDLLLERGYPPAAVLLELYMSGELSYTLGKIAELGMIEQSALHSPTSQYGSMSRGMRFWIPELRTRMQEGLEEIRSGKFAREWAAEQKAGYPTLEIFLEAARSLPLYQLEQELRQALHDIPDPQLVHTDQAPNAGQERLRRRQAKIDELAAGAVSGRETPRPATPTQSGGEGLIGRGLAGLRRLSSYLRQKLHVRASTKSQVGVLDRAQMRRVLRSFITYAANDPALQEFAGNQQITIHYVLSEPALEFHMHFHDGVVSGDLGPPSSPAEVRLEMKADVLDGMFTSHINAMRAAMTGKLSFRGDTVKAMSLQKINTDLTRLYNRAREELKSSG